MTSQGGSGTISLHPISNFFVDNMDQISSLWAITRPHTEFSWWKNTSNLRIFNKWSGLQCSLALILLNTNEALLDVQLQLEYQLQQSSMSQEGLGARVGVVATGVDKDPSKQFETPIWELCSC
ncbi:hypothetical protein TNCV_1924391 [Trichonephila clavipes]|nr:hypothetical protein TNCV_1924391 [Trichonephila clavipes]